MGYVFIQSEMHSKCTSSESMTRNSKSSKTIYVFLASKKTSHLYKYGVQEK